MSSAMPLCGSHECCPASVKASDCSMPMAMPAAAVGSINSKWPTAAAASAGTTASVYAEGVSGLMGAMRIPACTGNDGARHPVEQRDALGRDTAHERPDLCFRDRPRKKTEASPAVQRRQERP